MDYTDKIGSPPLFRKWTAIFTIAAAAERKVHVTTNKGVLYPNIYTIMVGPPGAGKTVAGSIASDFIGSLKTHHLAPSSVSRASLTDALHDASRTIVRPQDAIPTHQFNSLTIVSNELGTLIPAYESDFMNVLTDLYDCRIYTERKRTKDLKLEIKNPQLNFLAATTPSYLNNLLPEGAWDQGFLSRTMLIYSGANDREDLWAANVLSEKLRNDLTNDLKQIAELWGRVVFEEEAAKAISEWHVKGGEPAPDHPKLIHYNTRRTAHLLKLCTINSIACGDSLVVSMDNFVEALDWLLEAESFMPDIFKSMRTGGDGNVMDETWYHAYEIWMKEKRPIAEHRLTAFISERTPAHNVARILEVMCRARILTQKAIPNVGVCYEPAARR